MSRNFKIYLIFGVLSAIAFSCENKSGDTIKTNYIEFSITGKIDGEEIAYSNSYSTVRDTFYSTIFNSLSTAKIINVVRYSPDYSSHIEMNFEFDSAGERVPGSLMYETLNYNIHFPGKETEKEITLRTIVFTTFEGISITPFAYSNVVLDEKLGKLTGEFQYPSNDKLSSCDYLIVGSFDINLYK